MGEAKRRKQLDPAWGKRNLIRSTFEIYKDLMAVKTKQDEKDLYWKIIDFYRIALFHDSPGITVLDSSLLTANEMIHPSAVTVIHDYFVALNDLNIFNFPHFPIKEIKAFASDIDFSRERIVLKRFSFDNKVRSVLIQIPVAEIKEHLKASENLD